MYKLVFIILTLSGFLFYKAFTIKGARHTNFKKPSVSGSPKTVAINPKSKSIKSLPGAAPSNKPDAPIAQPIAAEFQTGNSGEIAAREDFDSLKDVYQSSEEVEGSRLTPEEREKHEQTVEQIKRIEAEAAAKRNGSAGKAKRPEDLTEEEKKNFEIYK